MAKTSSARATALLAGTLLVVSGILGRQLGVAAAAGELKVTLVGEVRSEQYPTAEVTLSAVDVVTGRPVTELTADGVELSDESGRLQVVDVSAVPSEKVPTAYVLLIDTGGAMSPYLVRATEVARGFIQRMGPSDVVRLVKFNDGVDDTGTNWVRRDDPNLAAQVSNLIATGQISLVKPALSRATEIAGTAPDGYGRHAVVALVAIDGARTETGLSIDKVKADVRAPTFAFGFGTAPIGHEELTFFLEEVRTYTGGAYWPTGSPTFPTDPFSTIFDAMQRTWRIRFRADSLPDGNEHSLKVTVRDSLQRSGQETAAYRSGRVGSVSPIQFKGIAGGDSVNGDRDIEVSIGGEKKWASWKIELFRDCDPSKCGAVASSDNRSLDWKLLGAPLEQGNHQLTARLTVSDGQREFTDIRSVKFTRAGTSWNFFAPALAFGLGAIVLVLVLAFARRAALRR